MKDKGVYEIRIGTVLDEKWGTYFSPFNLIPGQAETILTGVAHDQAELFGILLKIRDLGLQLVSVNPVESNKGSIYNK
jgi:hypothetical protein